MPGWRKDASPEFGGQWTLEKLQILERYLDAYTTALKDKPFKLWYIDAFAGSGSIKIPGGGEEAYLFLSGDEEARGFVEGSAARAIEIRDKPFDKFVSWKRIRFVATNCEILLKIIPIEISVLRMPKPMNIWLGSMMTGPVDAVCCFSTPTPRR